jgi:type IV fimbrial biogenesis protein FimT
VLKHFHKNELSGFSLIELLIGVAVLSILVSLAAPGMKIWLQNAQIRNAAESVQNGMQRARAEAVARNMNVEFVLSGTDANCKAANTCSSWVVREAVGHASIESRNSGEGSADITRSVLDAGATTVTFNNFGGRVSNADGSAAISSITFDSDPAIMPASDSRELRITIGASGVGGTVRMCDPSLPSSNPRGC